MGEALARVFDRRPDVRSPTLAAVLPLHARGPRALSLVCFNMKEPGEEGPMGSGSAPTGLAAAVKTIPNLGFMEAPFVALAERVESALTDALKGKAGPDDVKAAVSEAVGILRTELTRALQTTSDSAAKRMEALEGRVGEAETAAGSAASAASEAQSTADGRATPAQVAEAVQEAVRPLAARVEALEAANTELKAALDERPTKKDVLAAVKKVVQGALRTAAKLVGVEDEAEPEPK